MKKLSDTVKNQSCAYCGQARLRCIMVELGDHMTTVVVKCMSPGCYSADCFVLKNGDYES